VVLAAADQGLQVELEILDLFLPEGEEVLQELQDLEVPVVLELSLFVM
jgi:hypothetical protein